MQEMKKSPRRGRTKCYIHEVQRPLSVPYKELDFHICWICQERMFELANAGYQFKHKDQVVTLSINSIIDEEETKKAQGFKAEKLEESAKEA